MYASWCRCGVRVVRPWLPLPETSRGTDVFASSRCSVPVSLGASLFRSPVIQEYGLSTIAAGLMDFLTGLTIISAVNTQSSCFYDMIADFPIHWHDCDFVVRPLIATCICNFFFRPVRNRQSETSHISVAGGCAGENRFVPGLPGAPSHWGVQYRPPCAQHRCTLENASV